MIRRLVPKPPAAEMSAAEWFSRAPKAFAAEIAAMREKTAERLKSERDAALRRAREAEAQLRELGVEDAPSEANGHRPVSGNEGDPSQDWSVWRLVKYYLRTNGTSQAPDVIAFVLSIRPGGEDDRVMEKNVLATLYKHSRPGRSLKQTGERGSFRYTLREAET